jgi:tetratricopeptide (TPR) repeat protein/cell division protein FtsN
MQNLIDNVIKELEQKNYFEAIKYCNQLIAQFPRNYVFYEIRGNCYLETGSFVIAIQNYTEAIGYIVPSNEKLKSDIASIYNRRGYARLKLNLYNEAIGDFQKAVDLKPDFAEAYNNCGNAFRKLERYEEALVQCNRAIEYKQDFAEAYNNRGNIYYLFSRDNEAISDYTKAIELRQNYTGAYYNRGATYYYLQNKLIEARNDWEKVIKLNPSYERELKERIDKINEALKLTQEESGLSLVKKKIHEESSIESKEPETEKPVEHYEKEKHEEPVLEIYEETIQEKKEEDKPLETELEKFVEPKVEKVKEQKPEEPKIETPEEIKNTDIEIPEIDFKSMFNDEEKESEIIEDDIKPLTEIFEQIYQPKIEKEDIISEEVKQLHKEIEEMPSFPPPPEDKNDKYIEELINKEETEVPEDISLPEELHKREKVSEHARLISPIYSEEEEKRSIFKSPLFLVPLVFIILIILSVSAYVLYSKIYVRKLQTDKQEVTSELKDTAKNTANVDSSQIRDTVSTGTENKEDNKQEEKVEKKTETNTQEVTAIKNFVVIKENDGIYLQVASLKEKSSADTRAGVINKKGINAKVIEADLGSKGKYYRIRIGPFKTIDEAKTAANKID